MLISAKLSAAEPYCRTQILPQGPFDCLAAAAGVMKFGACGMQPLGLAERNHSMQIGPSMLLRVSYYVLAESIHPALVELVQMIQQSLYLVENGPPSIIASPISLTSFICCSAAISSVECDTRFSHGLARARVQNFGVGLSQRLRDGAC